MPHRTLPRSIDRGLIEARLWRSTSRARHAPFRDLLIAASLKPAHIDGDAPGQNLPSAIY